MFKIALAINAQNIYKIKTIALENNSIGFRIKLFIFQIVYGLLFLAHVE